MPSFTSFYTNVVVARAQPEQSYEKKAEMKTTLHEHENQSGYVRALVVLVAL